ncbi:MAG: hypothetical protein ACTJLK_00880 [Anaplasma sp.]
MGDVVVSVVGETSMGGGRAGGALLFSVQRPVGILRGTYSEEAVLIIV